MSAANDDDPVAFTPRVEDDALVRGAGRFVDDAPLPSQAYACFVRSPHACARIVALNVEAARAAPGVLAVLTPAEMSAAGIGSISRHPPMVGRNGSKPVVPVRLPLAAEQVMHVGQPVAAVIAESAQVALDAAEQVAVEYEAQPAVTDVRAAIKSGAPRLHEQAPDNIAFDWPGPASNPDANAREVERIIAAAAHVATVTVVQQRLVVASIEPRGATASYDPANDSYLLRVCSQSAGTMHDVVASALGLDKGKLRIVTEDVGGAFGMKTPIYPEYPVLLLAARLTGRPVHWMASRSEAFLSDNQGRDNVSEATLALDASGKFLALKVRALANLGAYMTPPGAHVPTNNFVRCLPGMYDIGAIDCQVRCVFTNTLPVGPYRGAGRPEANTLLERVVDEAARVTGIDPANLRRRNLIPKRAVPYKTPVGTTYDSGDFLPILDQALVLADYAGIKSRKRAAHRRHRHRGIGICCFLEHSGGTPLEGAMLAFPGGGTVTLGLNVQSTGQGHASVFPRIVAQRLGIPADRIIHRHGDSSLGIAGGSSVASRSAMTAGSAIVKAVELALEKGKRVAASMLEAGESDIAYADGHFTVVGTDRKVTLFEVAAHAAGTAQSLDTNTTAETPQTFPNGCHIAEVEIDPDTGMVEVVAYTAVEDCGVVLDPMLVHGQVHGGVVQGLGQALMERVAYDDGGQLVSASFMDYALPHAHDVPDIRDSGITVPATTNPLGVKGVGEAGTTAAIAAIMNAIADAIPGGAGRALDMPATAAKVWRACRAAKPH